MGRKIQNKQDILLKRAGYKCEYCHEQLLNVGWQKEHINPKGPDDISNLAVACARCNLNKSDRIYSDDPVSGLTVPLYNPRKDQWIKHFEFSENHLVGKTVIGRATATLLFRMTKQHLPEDLKWSPIQQIKNNEELYLYLNHLRSRRLANQFSFIENEMRNQQYQEMLQQVDAENRQIAKSAIQLISLEMLFTRSSLKDVWEGIRLAHILLKRTSTSEAKFELSKILSILLQQLATIYALKGRYKEAQYFQTQASKAYSMGLPVLDKWELHHRIRYVTMLEKYNIQHVMKFCSDDIKMAIEQAQKGQLNSLVYLADAELRSTSKHFENVISVIDEALNACGYGQDFDFARSIVLRRRWWGLKLLAGEECNLDLLAKDIRLWLSINMHNEIRELLLLIENLKPRVGNEKIENFVQQIYKNI